MCNIDQDFENRITKEQARSQLRGWKGLVRESGIECFDSFLNTLKERMRKLPTILSSVRAVVLLKV